MSDVIMGIVVCGLLISTWEHWKNQRDLRKIIERVNAVLAKADPTDEEKADG